MSRDIVLATLNARYAHAAFGLRYLLANMGDLAPRTDLVEFVASAPTDQTLESLLARNPRILGLGVYIWNVEAATRLVRELKRLRPELIIVLGGPEVSYETDEQEIVRAADYVITGEGDLAFAELCRQILSGSRPQRKVIAAELPVLDRLQRPYDLYTAEDISRRVIYVEASRGCPYSCEFCLSALEIPVRQFPLDRFLAALGSLFDRGARQFKFVDRTFNLNLRTSRAILDFFYERYEPGLFLHFEMIPDRFPETLRDSIRRFPAGALQFEVGVQTFNEHTAELISRRQDNQKLEANLRFLRSETGVHVHADLIVGLPGESLASFAAGFDRLLALGPQEIQVGMLKRLRGTPIIRHDTEWAMNYSLRAPYEILSNRSIDADTMARLARFARFWDLVANSGNFIESAPLLWRDRSAFAGFLAFADWLYARTARTWGIPLTELAESVFRYLVDTSGQDPKQTADTIWRDYQRGGRPDRPAFLSPYVEAPSRRTILAQPSRARRQARHQLS
ncbi:MAG TPA: DUF4080 domain-containing protein [Planctomycetaceae bacterium]|nr:DUF4080 domain-containing protein [Planctomycetaceae bacterium]